MKNISEKRIILNNRDDVKKSINKILGGKSELDVKKIQEIRKIAERATKFGIIKINEVDKIIEELGDEITSTMELGSELE